MSLPDNETERAIKVMGRVLMDMQQLEAYKLLKRQARCWAKFQELHPRKAAQFKTVAEIAEELKQ